MRNWYLSTLICASRSSCCCDVRSDARARARIDSSRRSADREPARRSEAPAAVEEAIAEVEAVLSDCFKRRQFLLFKVHPWTLLEHAEKLGPLEQQRLVNQQNNLNGGTALMVSATNPRLELLQRLMEARAETRRVFTEEGEKLSPTMTGLKDSCTGQALNWFADVGLERESGPFRLEQPKYSFRSRGED